MTKQEITSRYAFDERQTDYYTNAGRYLGFLEKDRNAENSIVFRLSPQGQAVLGESYRSRQLLIAAGILKHQVFQNTLKKYLKAGEMPDKKTIVQIMKGAGLYHVGAESTYLRRSSTVEGWIQWIIGLVDQ